MIGSNFTQIKDIWCYKFEDEHDVVPPVKIYFLKPLNILGDFLFLLCFFDKILHIHFTRYIYKLLLFLLFLLYDLYFLRVYIITIDFYFFIVELLVLFYLNL
jgi:hypothetical protein